MDSARPDVSGDKFLEIKYEEFRQFINKLRAQSGLEKHSVTDSRGSDEGYIVDAGYSLDVYNGREHILYHREHEYSVLYTALRKAEEKRETFDYEELARSYAESLKRQSYWEITRMRGKTEFTVNITDPDTVHVYIDFVDDIRADEHTDDDHIHVSAKDGSVTYQFKLDATGLPGAPDE